QDLLRLELKKRRCAVTQATLSRDLAELGVGRMTSAEGPRYVLQPGATEVQVLKPVVGTQVLSILSNENLIVVKTLPGCASIVGEFIDVQPHPESSEPLPVTIRCWSFRHRTRRDCRSYNS